MMQVTKVWWDGEKLMAEPIDPAAVYKEPLDSLLDEAKLLADDRPVEIGHLPQWALDAEHMIRRLVKAVNAAPQPAQQESVAWTPINQPYPPGGELDILMGDGSILCEVLPQADGDLWWGGASTGERFIDPKYASVTHWRIHAEHTSPPAQRTWVGLTESEKSAALYDKDGMTLDYEDYAYAIEAKLKEKNT